MHCLHYIMLFLLQVVRIPLQEYSRDTCLGLPYTYILVIRAGNMLTFINVNAGIKIESTLDTTKQNCRKLPGASQVSSIISAFRFIGIPMVE